MHTSPNPFPLGASVVAYLRDSGGEEQDLSTSEQQNALQEWCSTQNLRLSHVFRDDARPGSSTLTRPIDHLQRITRNLLEVLTSDDVARKRTYLKLLINRIDAEIEINGNSAHIRGVTYYYSEEDSSYSFGSVLSRDTTRTHNLYSLSWVIQIR